jgi:hypothetical protein
VSNAMKALQFIDAHEKRASAFSLGHLGAGRLIFDG